MKPGEWGRGPEHGPVPPPGHDEGPSSAATPTRPGSSIIRPMPKSDAAGSFEDLAQKSVLSRARDDARFVAPELTPQDTPTRRLPLRPLLILAVLMLSLGVLGGLLWVNVFRTVGVDEKTTVTPSAGSQEKILTPQETVRGYLEALEAGDARKALTFGPEPPGIDSLAMVRQSGYDAMPATSRPSDIRILTEDPLATEIRVQYSLAGKPVSTSMRVVRQDNDSYLMERVTVTIQLQVVGSEKLPVQLNGVAIRPTDPIAVFPGTYTPSTGLPLVAFQDSELITIASLNYTDTVVFLINPVLTPAGRDGFERATRASLDRCIASGELAPTGCPNAILAPRPVLANSVRWEVLDPGSVWENFTPTLSPTDQTMAVATLSMQLRVSMDYKDGQSSGNKDSNLNIAVSANMMGENAASINVVWGG